MELDFGGGRKVHLREHQKYLPSCDGQGIRLSIWYEGNEYWCESLVEPGKSIREAREKGSRAIEAAVRAGTPGKIDLNPKPREVERQVEAVPINIPVFSDAMKRRPGRPRKEQE